MFGNTNTIASTTAVGISVITAGYTRNSIAKVKKNNEELRADMKSLIEHVGSLDAAHGTLKKKLKKHEEYEERLSDIEASVSALKIIMRKIGKKMGLKDNDLHESEVVPNIQPRSRVKLPQRVKPHRVSDSDSDERVNWKPQYSTDKKKKPQEVDYSSESSESEESSDVGTNRKRIQDLL